MVAPFPSPIFFSAAVTDEHCLACQAVLPRVHRDLYQPNRRAREISCRFSSTTNAPRAQQADQRLLLLVELRIARAHDAQMWWPEIVDRSPVEILLDDRGTDVRGPRHHRRISEPLTHRSHHRRDHTLLLGR